MKRIVASIVISILLVVGAIAVQGASPAYSSLSLAITITPSSPPSPPGATLTPAPPPPGEDPEPGKLPSTGQMPGWAEFFAPLKLPFLYGQQSPVAQPEENRTTGMRIYIPAVDSHAWIERAPYEAGGWDVEHLGLTVGWLETSAYPGEEDNSVLVGHLNVKGVGPGPFNNLYRVKPGSQVLIYRDNQKLVYTVKEQKVVGATDLDILKSNGSSQITLVTCSSWNSATQSYAKRLVLVADLTNVISIKMQRPYPSYKLMAE